MDTPNIECPPELKEQEGLIWITKKHELVKLSYLLNTHNKIILHGLFLSSLITSLFFQPWLLKKCYWVMWGGDFYFPEKQSWLKKQVIKRIRNFVTYMKGDFEYLKKYYGAKGTYHESFMYPSNLYKEYQIKTKEDGGIINIQVGNSADSTNNHIEIFENLRKFKDENIKIYAPLSYSDQDHAKDVIAKGKEMFGDKFVALTDFMSFEKYLEFLADIDIAIFAHNRQQGMGNTISLLGMGKKVYMKNDITPWTLFGEIGVKVFDFNNIDLESINSEVMNENIKIIKSYFSEDKYIRQLEILFK
ncbi:MAG: TDP-N-acetylfucosamine:lipid II N-acetylfucosaminyltransferase [Pelagibacterales bacterium]|nr:TDP-N-acetylfucosamine:lipid II N-acetylfucosaminyltransferase [Pelagibacterales bacterium]